MKTTALRLYGKNDLRLESFDLPEIGDDEILATVVTDSICLSSWKEANLGADHKKYQIMWQKIPLLLVMNFAVIFCKSVRNGSINSNPAAVM